MRRRIAEVVTAKKRLEMQKLRLWDNIRTLEEQSRRAIDQDREDLAKLALERKKANMLQTYQDLDFYSPISSVDNGTFLQLLLLLLALVVANYC